MGPSLDRFLVKRPTTTLSSLDVEASLHLPDPKLCKDFCVAWKMRFDEANAGVIQASSITHLKQWPLQLEDDAGSDSD